MLFKSFFNESNHKPNKKWVIQGSEFYHRSMKSYLQDNDIEMYSTRNKGLTRTLKNKICKYMLSISKNVYIDKLDDIVNI